MSIPTPQGGLLEISRGRAGVPKAKICNRKHYNRNWNFQRDFLFFFLGGGVLTKKTPVGGV